MRRNHKCNLYGLDITAFAALGAVNVWAGGTAVSKSLIGNCGAA